MDRASLFRFEGCPQDDAVGQEVFAAVRDVELNSHELARLAGVFSHGTYPDCQFIPLQEWLVEVVERLHERGGSGLQSLAFQLGEGPESMGWVAGAIFERDLQLAFLKAAEDETVLLGIRQRIAHSALRHRPTERQVEEAIEVLTRPIPRRTKTELTYRLGRTRGSEFFVPLATAATTFSDSELFTVTSAIGTDVQDGRVAGDAAGLEALRELVRQRPDLPPWAQIPYGPR